MNEFSGSAEHFNERDTEPVGAKPFETLPTPEYKPGMHEFKSIHHETLELTKHHITDEKNREIYHHERTHTDPDNPTAENRKSDWQKFSLEFDDQDRVTKERSQSLIKGKENQSYREHAYHEDGSQLTKGRIEAGEATGHAYETLRKAPVDLGHGRQMIEEKTTILEQGDSPKKPAAGTEIVKNIFMEKGQYVGERWTNLKTKDTGINLPKNAEKLPDWAAAA